MARPWNGLFTRRYTSDGVSMMCSIMLLDLAPLNANTEKDEPLFRLRLTEGCLVAYRAGSLAR